MESQTPSFISTKRLLAYYGLVCLVLSIPIFYLSNAGYTEFKNKSHSTRLELSGTYIIDGLLKYFSLLGETDYIADYERGKDEIKEKLIVKNILHLTPEQLKEASSFFDEKKIITKEILIQDYYRPLIRFVANHSNLVLDPDLDSYYFMDILVLRLPGFYSILANFNRSNVLSRHKLEDLQAVLDEINYSLRTAVAEHKKRSYPKHYSFPHMKNYLSIADEINAQLAGKKNANINEIIPKLQNLEYDVRNDLDEILLKRHQTINEDKNVILMGTLLFWILGIVSGFFLFIRILKYQSEILDRYTAQSRQLEVSEKLSFVGEIATSIAHEVKNPLTIIDFESASIRKNLNSEQFDKERAFLRLTKISEMSHRINKISNLITIFTRKSDNDPFESVPFKKILDDILYLTKLKALEMGISIEVTPLDFDICCRPIQLEQVFINLINNAIDAVASLPERWVKIVPTLIEKEGEEWVVVRVVDSGNGIKKEVVDKMFESFFTTKTSGKGTGLGLSVSLRIIEDHRGKFYYDEHAEHTTFVVEIPRIQPLV